VKNYEIKENYTADCGGGYALLVRRIGKAADKAVKPCSDGYSDGGYLGKHGGRACLG
jgi:hypothetical protein